LIIVVERKFGHACTRFRRNANSINATLETNWNAFTKNVRMTLIAGATNLNARQSGIGLSGVEKIIIIITIYFNFHHNAG
jgi:hypothetical protein